MWNHSTDMLDQTLRQGRSWPRLSGRDTRDLLAYLWDAPALLPTRSPFRFGDDVRGRAVFNGQCAECHTLDGPTATGRVDLTRPLRSATMLQFAASMWNHAPAMKRRNPGRSLPLLNENDARDLVTYLVVGRAFAERGDARFGAGIFRRKNCAACHEEQLVSTAPRVGAMKGPFNAVRLTASLWSHGPAMLESMRSRKLQWPRFTPQEMSDLIAYLNENSAK
jgi:mono/diheme cytochrome c family protein